MNDIHEILTELNENNGSNYKIDVLKKYKDNELLKRVFKMALDKVTHTYGIKKIPEHTPMSGRPISLEQALNLLENEFVTRNYTGNTAIDVLQSTLNNLSVEDADLICKIIDRDLKVNVGRSNTNKVWKDLIVKPVYMRCGIFSNDKMVEGKLVKGTSRKINPKGAFLQLKADGTYRETVVDSGRVSYNSRSGESYDYPLHTEEFKKYTDGKYIGELTVVLDDELLAEILPKIRKEDPEMADKIENDYRDGKKILPRSLGNGLINSDNPPHKNIVFELWDYVTHTEYNNALNKITNTTRYEDRFDTLVDIVPGYEVRKISVIETHRVNSIKEALQITSGWMTQGLEGGILKDADAVFRDGTSPQQLKLKLEIDIDVRILGFEAGNKGSKNEKYFSSVLFGNDEGTIKGSVGVTSMTEATRDWMFARMEELTGKVMTVQCNDITTARGNDFYALSHPRYIEIRDDKNTTDTLERAFEQRDSSMQLNEEL